MEKKNGFSLIELMTAVAIIAIISIIAVPSYKTFQARARQKEGLALLNSFYSAAVATRTEFGTFPGNFVGTGFAPAGALIYRIRTDDNPNPVPGENAFNNDNNCINTDNTRPCDCATNCPNFKTWSEITIGIIGTSLGVAGVQSGASNCTIGVFPSVTTDSTFLVGVAAVISTTATSADRYYMNEQKVIEMCNDGLK